MRDSCKVCGAGLLLLVGCARSAEDPSIAAPPPVPPRVEAPATADPPTAPPVTAIPPERPEPRDLAAASNLQEPELVETESSEESGDADFTSTAPFDFDAGSNDIGLARGASGLGGSATGTQRAGRSGRGRPGNPGGSIEDVLPLDPVLPPGTVAEAFDVENAGAEHGAAVQEPAEPDRFHDPARPARRIEIYDGYGQRWCDEEVFEHLRPRPRESARAMFFRYYGDNPAIPTEIDPLSTFAADVDTASFALARHYLRLDRLPPKEAIRTEEFLNAFPSALAPPEEGDFAIHLEYAPTPFGGASRALLKVGIKAREVDAARRKQLNLTWVVDSSGSMSGEDRLGLVKRSLRILLDQLGPEDRVGIVRFADRAEVVLEPTPVAEHWRILEAVEGLTAGGSTNADEGLRLGYLMAEAAYREGCSNRVVLCSDGVANTGETDQQRILEQVRRFSTRQIDLTTLGVGMGNHNDVFLERLADAGDGACHYIDDELEAQRLFERRFLATMQTVAREVKIQVEFAPHAVARWRQLGYENRSLRDQDFRRDSVDAGEIGSGHEVVALYELEEQPEPSPAEPIATVRLRWQPDGSAETVEIERSLRWNEQRARWEDASRHFRLSAVAAQFAEVLRRSYWAREDSLDELLRAAEGVAAELPATPAPELAGMIRRAFAIDSLQPAARGEFGLLFDAARRLRLLEAECRERGPSRAELGDMLERIHRQNEELERQLGEWLRQGR